MVLRTNLAESGLARSASGTVLAMGAGMARDVMGVLRMLAHPSEDIARKTAEITEIETTGQQGTCEAYLRSKAKRYVVPKMTNERVSFGFFILFSLSFCIDFVLSLAVRACPPISSCRLESYCWVYIVGCVFPCVPFFDHEVYT